MNENLNEQLKKLQEQQEAHWKECWKGCEQYPEKLKKIGERICMSYGIRGICDPAYITNIIAIELGLGDGKGNFYDPPTPSFYKPHLPESSWRD